MQKSAIPPYKPPPEINKLLEKQINNHRLRTAVLPHRNWIYRNPKFFQITFITVSLLVFFSKPLYDAFVDTSLPLERECLPPHKR